MIRVVPDSKKRRGSHRVDLSLLSVNDDVKVLEDDVAKWPILQGISLY